MDTKQTLSRLFSASLVPEEFNEIFSLDSCNVDSASFLSKLDIIKYFQNSCERSDPIKAQTLLEAMTAMNSESSDEKQSLLKAILATISYIEDDVNIYLRLNPILTFALVFIQHMMENGNAQKSTTLCDLFLSKEELIVNSVRISSLTLEQVTTALLHLDVKSKESKADQNMYNLLDGFRKFNVANFFKWRFDDTSRPKFGCDEWSKMYGHEEKLNYIYYLREARPNIAVRSLYSKDPRGTIKDLSTKM